MPTEMTKEKYRAFVREKLAEIIKLIDAKNEDYSHGTDPFANFRISDGVGVDPLVGLWIRMEDKCQRVRAYLKRGDLKVPGEGIDDAFRDLIGYSLLALGMIKERTPSLEERVASETVLEEEDAQDIL